MIGIGCSCTCSYDGPPAELWTEIIRTARKEHKCAECGEVIERGKKYLYTKALQDGEWWDSKTCLPCNSIAQDLLCGCYSVGMMWVDIEQMLDIGDNGDWLK